MKQSSPPPTPPRADTEIEKILGNLTFIVGMAHVKAAENEITPEECSERTHSEIAQAQQALIAWRDKSIREAEIRNLTALKNYMVGGSATFADWVNYLNDRIAELSNQGGKI